MGFLSDTVIGSLKAVQAGYKPVFADTSYYASGCGCTGDCGQSCSGDCYAGCSGDCGRSCAGMFA